MDKIKEFENQLAILSNQDLVEKVEQFFIKEKKIGDAILIGLKEIKTRRVYNWLGYPSMFDMLIKYYKLSEAGAYQRINALKVIEAVPEAQNLLVSGVVSMGTLTEMQSFINKQEKATGEKVTTTAKKQFVDEIKNKSVKETREHFIDKNPSLNLPPDKVQKITSELTLVQMKLDSENIKLIEELKIELSHKIPNGNWNELIKVMLTTTLDQVRKKKGLVNKAQQTMKQQNTTGVKKVELENTQNVFKKPTPSMESQCVTKRSHIPLKIKRAVFKKAHFQCQYVSPQGKRCDCKTQLEVNHILPVSQGGTHDDVEKINLLCASHNKYYNLETHGYIYKPKN